MGVFSYIVSRCLQTISVLFLLSILVFMIVHLLPGDPAVTLAGPDATEERIAQVREQLGLDKPLYVQYIRWLGNVLQGDLGYSMSYSQDVNSLIATRFPITLQILVFAIILSLLVGIPAGILAAIRRGGVIDSLITFLTNLGISLPNFWLGILAVFLFSLTMGWLPVQGYVSPFEDVGQGFKHLILPVLVVSALILAQLTRQTRSAFLEVINKDYIRTARSKGLKERIVIFRHGLRNALIPVITLLGTLIGALVGGMIFVEQVFNIPGMGRLMVQAILAQDYIVVQGCVLVIGTIVSLVNLIVDISYSIVDPRIRYR